LTVLLELGTIISEEGRRFGPYLKEENTMGNPAENPEEWMTATEARLLLGIGKTKLAEWLKNGTLQGVASPFDKRVILVKRSDVDRLNSLPRPKIAPARAA
jgi:hypothetical protein